MRKAKIKIEKDLFDRIAGLSKIAGYSSPDEFIRHCLEKEVARLEEANSEEEVKKKLKGLGYIS